MLAWSFFALDKILITFSEIIFQVTKLPSWRVILSAPYILELKHVFKPLQVILSAGDNF